MRRSEMIEKIAIAIHHNWMSDEDYLASFACPRIRWNKLEEHERDDRRFEAEAALKCVEDALNDLQFQQTLIVEPGKYKNNKPVGSPVTKTETKIVWTPEEE